jgi:hypothetical protein
VATPWGVREGIDDPVHFQREWLGRKLWEKQKEIARSVRDNPLTAVKGCHASGKTFLAAGLPLHHLVRFKRGKVFTTAPTLRQVKAFWQEVSLARRDGTVRNLLPECTTTGLTVADDRFALGASSSAGVQIQGFHGTDVLLIADEAPGIDTDIWDAIEGIRAGGRVRLLMMGNPVVPSGKFFDAFTRERRIHNCISISAFDTPNLAGVTIEQLLEMTDAELDECAYPALITRRWVKERYQVWGPNHPQYRSRVLAEFPDDDPYSLFSLAKIEAMKRDPTEAELRAAENHYIQVGIDVAGPGHDETTMVARVGGILLGRWAWPDADSTGPVAHILHQLCAHRKYRLGLVVGDIVGIGYYFMQHLAGLGMRSHGEMVQFFGFVEQAVPLNPNGFHQFKDQKAESAWVAREWVHGGFVSIDPEAPGLVRPNGAKGDDELEAQLCSVRYRENSRGQIEIESKVERKQRGIPGSPDRMESFCMAFLRVQPQVVTETYPVRPYVISPI